jgi:O-antigen/teichoic acid export membrane protein
VSAGQGLSVATVPSRGLGAGVVRSGALTFVGGVIAAIGGFLLTLAVARGLGVERSGVFFVSLGLFSILTNTLELGADTGLVRSIPRLRTLGRSDELTRTVLVAIVPVLIGGCVAAVLVAEFSPTLARVFMQQGSTVLGASFLRAVAPYLAVAPVATVLIAGTRGFGSVIPFVTIQNIAMPLARPLVIGLLVVGGVTSDRAIATAWGLPWAVAAVIAVALVAGALRREPAVTAVDSRRSNGAVAAEFWAFASTGAFAGAAEVTLVWLDVLLVGWLVGPDQAGIYAAASRFVTTGSLALQATRIATAPRLAALLTAGRTTDAERLFNGGSQAVVATSWPLYLGLAFFSPVILRLFGHGFTAGATALTILSVAMLVDTATGNIGSVLLMAGSSRWNLFNAVAGLGVDIVVDVILIPRHGATGAAIGWAAAIVVINVLACLEVHYLMKLRIFDLGTIRTAAAAALCFGVPGVVLAIAVQRSLTSLAVWIVVGVTTYLTWWWRRRHDPDVVVVLGALGLRKPPPETALPETPELTK